MKRGAKYEEIKNRIGKRIWEQTCKLFPQVQDKVDFFDVGSPLSNRYEWSFLFVCLFVFSVSFPARFRIIIVVIPGRDKFKI